MERLVEYLQNNPLGVPTTKATRECSLTRSKLIALINENPHISYNDDIIKYTSTNKKPESNPTLLILIDLGNVHNCLKNILPYVESRCCDVRCYADQMSNCFGISPKVDNPHVKVTVASDNHKNAADTEMIWDCATLPSIYTDICLVTKDLGFQTLVTKLRQTDRKVTLVHNWENLHDFLQEI